MSAIAGTSIDAASQARWERAYLTAFPVVYRGLVALGARVDEAEDALHDAFLKGLTTTNVDRIEGWLFVVSLRTWRRGRIRARLFLPFTAGSRTPAPDTDAASRVTLFGALRALPFRQRQILVARYVIGLSQEETAHALGIARGTVSATTSQAASALRRLLEDQG